MDFKELDWEGVNKRLGLEVSNKRQGPMNLAVLRGHLMNFCVLKNVSVSCSWLVNITLNIAKLSELQEPIYNSSEISPTRCNNCVFIFRNGFTLHVSGYNLTHHQEYICCIWPQVSRLT